MSTSLENRTESIRFEYLYRDAGNNKNYGEVIFSNNLKLSLEEIERRIQQCFVDGCYFNAKEWNLPDLHLKYWDEAIDHEWHEYMSVSKSNQQTSYIDITALFKNTQV
ncbi:MAG: hypothetical protein H0X33_12060 [Taibaiella sp.]|nr:hypothetical protein [Taibaiella sp.]